MLLYNDLDRLQARYLKTRTTKGWQGAMKIVLISTYELGRQPFGLVSPAAWLRNRGHAVTCFDLTRQELDERAVGSAAVVAIYLPTHTATRPACELIPSVPDEN